MKRKHSTKRALIASILSLCLCFSMLIGTTFAWFTDSVTSSGNIIQSGTLKIGMYWSDGTEAVPADESTDWTDASTGPIFKYDKWEPGYTEARHIKIANEGTLALKYAIRIIPDGKVSELADVIDVYYADPAKQIANRGELTTDMKLGTLTQVLNNMGSTAAGNLAAEASDTITLVLKMQESAGNEYQGKSIGSSFSIQLVATQDTVEADSFDKLYDAEAPFYGSTSVPAPAPGESAAEIDVLNDKNEKMGSIVVPTTAIADGATEILVNISETDHTPNITVAAGSETETFDLYVSNLKDNNDVPVKVALFIGKNLDPATVQVYHYIADMDEDVLVFSTYNANTGYVTFETTSFSPYTLVYDKDSTYIPPVADSNVPTAGVSVKNEYVGVSLPWGSYGQWSPNAEVDADPKLEAAYLFTCTQTFEQAKESGYADWECDFFVKLDRALGENQIFLGGNYGSFGWVGFHNGDVTLDANTEIPLLGSVTSNPWTYGEVINFVGAFTCGVGDVNDALSGATFTVTLRLTNPETNETIDVETITHEFN